MAKSGKKKTVICKQKSVIWVFEMEVVMEWGGGGRRKQKNVRSSGKILTTPLIRTQMIDRFVIPVGIQSRRIPHQTYS